MPFSAAIFDCDGTLIDSMPMWHDATVAMLEAHGVADPEAVFVETEPLPNRELCDYVHEHYVPDASGEELNEELHVAVRRGYAEDVRMLPGCREFLDSLRAASIPMVVASSTEVPLLEVALSAQGIRDYFQDVIATGGDIRSKEYPDVWRAALARLGTRPEETWVFEDAPFGMMSARKVGLRTVCLFSPHGDREEDECRAVSDVFVHGYPELSIALLDDYARPDHARPGEGRAEEGRPSEGRVGSGEKSAGETGEGSAGGGYDRGGRASMTALVVDGSPERSSAALVRGLASRADYVIAADAGAAVLEEAGVRPDVFCGDADSVPEGVVSWARDAADRDIRFPTEKYATDLSIAIDCARHEATRRSARLELVLTCASGGRPDHALAVVGQLAESADASPSLVEDSYECRILSPEGRSAWELPAGSVGKTFSAIAVAPGTVASERGLKWELDHKTLPLLGDEGVSNVVAREGATVECHSGRLAVFLLHV